jgi:hypothetical protein
MRGIILFLAAALLLSPLTFVYGQKIKVKDLAKSKKEDKKDDKKSGAQGASAAAFKVGDVAEALETDGKWYKVDILKVEPGKYFIHWQGFTSQYDRWIEAGKVRAAVASGSASAGGSSTTEASASSGSSASKAYSTEEGGFNVGEYAEALDRDGKWYEVEIQQATANELFVKPERYNGFWVKRANMRVKGSAPAAEPLVFNIGDKVHASYFGNYRPGLITNITEAGGQKKYAIAYNDGNKSTVTESELRLYNFTGSGFKVGQYVRVWYSGNDSLDVAIVNVKENKFMIPYGGYGAKWFDFDAKEVRNDARTAAVAASRALQDQFFQDVNKYSDAIRVFGYLYNKKYNTGFVLYNQGMTSPRPVDVAPMLKQMDELDALIKSKYPNIQNTEQTWTDELSKNPGHWRVIAENRKELAQSVVIDLLNQRLDDVTKYVGNYEYLKNEEIKQFEAGKGIGVITDLQDMLDNNGVNFAKEQEEKVADAIKAAQDANLGQNEIQAFRTFLKTLAQDIKRKFDGSLVATSFNPTIHDQHIEGVGRQYVQKTYPGATILKIGLLDNDFIIIKNNIGIPKNRNKKLGILIRDSKGRCRFLATYYVEEYAGGGTYNAGFIEHYYSYYQKL